MNNVIPIRAVEPKRSQMDDWRVVNPAHKWETVDEPPQMTLLEKIILVPAAITLVGCAVVGLHFLVKVAGYFV
jgi:hypothetical protein